MTIQSYMQYCIPTGIVQYGTSVCRILVRARSILQVLPTRHGTYYLPRLSQQYPRYSLPSTYYPGTRGKKYGYLVLLPLTEQDTIPGYPYSLPTAKPVPGQEYLLTAAEKGPGTNLWQVSFHKYYRGPNLPKSWPNLLASCWPNPIGKPLFTDIVQFDHMFANLSNSWPTPANVPYLNCPLTLNDELSYIIVL